jgi:hypothetical protein
MGRKGSSPVKVLLVTSSIEEQEPKRSHASLMDKLAAIFSSSVGGPDQSTAKPEQHMSSASAAEK